MDIIKQLDGVVDPETMGELIDATLISDVIVILRRARASITDGDRLSKIDAVLDLLFQKARLSYNFVLLN